nr:MAG TPA: hypothetical protein [Caudoviricetes sp.]
MGNSKYKVPTKNERLELLSAIVSDTQEYIDERYNDGYMAPIHQWLCKSILTALDRMSGLATGDIDGLEYSEWVEIYIHDVTEGQ